MTESFDDLETPAALVDLDRLERNLDRMAAYAAGHGVALRPHIKTHKSPRVGAEQLDRGAVGLTCATPREAEVMSEVCDDILVAYPLAGAHKAERLMALPDHVRLTVMLDSAEALRAVGEAARDVGRTAGVLVEMDVGMRRVGVATPADAVALAQLAAGAANVEYRGIGFYPGHVRAPVAEQTGELRGLAGYLEQVLDALTGAGLAPSVISGGSTPTAWRTHELPAVTEMRPGTYVYNDRTTAAIGACEWDDCAFTVLATVVSTAVAQQAVIDAGSKALSREPLRGAPDEGFGVLLDRPEVTVARMSEEHGVLDLSRSDWRPRVGDVVRIIPNHVCPVVHLNDVVYGVRAGRVETSWLVAARGRGHGLLRAREMERQLQGEPRIYADERG